jgi:hypothetical protein
LYEARIYHETAIAVYRERTCIRLPIAK